MYGARTFSTLVLCSVATVAACKRSEAPPSPAPSPVPQVQAPAQPPPAQVPAPVPAFKVVAIELGKQVSADKRVSDPAISFAPGDTVYASVASEGTAPSVALKARWTYQDGQLVNESVQTIAPSGPAATEFHISRPSGWPAGSYKVEISVNGAVVGTKDFEVKS